MIQGLEAFMSKHDLESGGRWSLDLSKALEESTFGILCLTNDNLQNLEHGLMSESFAPYTATFRTIDHAFKSMTDTERNILFEIVNNQSRGNLVPMSEYSDENVKSLSSKGLLIKDHIGRLKLHPEVMDYIRRHFIE
jgi:hypothetical protein